MGIAIKTIAPSHGIIWRNDPMKIINAYLAWAKNQTENKVVVVYETMWGATEEMARKIIEGISDCGVSAQLFDITQSDRTEIIKEMLAAKGYIFGSSTHDNGMLTTIAAFLQFLKGLKPKHRIAAAFGSYGWAGGAVKEIEGVLKEAGIEIAQPAISVQYVADEKELKDCYQFGKSFCDKLSSSK